MPAIKFRHLQFLPTILSVFFSFSALTAAGQNKNDTIQVLELRELKNYSEGNFFWGDSGITLRQETTFNDPKLIDEEFTQLLTMRLSPAINLTAGKTFDLIRDSALIKCTYDRLSVWNWSEKKTSIVGQITVLSTTKRKIELRLDITVTEMNKGVHVYSGTRLFKKSKPLTTYSYKLTAGNKGICNSRARRC